MKTRKTRRWYDRAACRDDDPDLYETPPALAATWNRPTHHRGTYEKTHALLNAGSRCDECPVVRECARDALACHDYGTIRAGIPVPDKTQQSARPIMRHVTTALQLVAHGAPPAAARGLIRSKMPLLQKAGGGSK